jgi:hypothetical protein
MSDHAELLSGIALVVVAFGVLALCIPRRGKLAWFVDVPIVESSVSIVVVAGIVLGLLFIAAHFTAIHEAALPSAAKHSRLSIAAPYLA